MKTQGFHLTLQYKDKDGNIQNVDEYFANDAGAHLAAFGYKKKGQVLSYSVNPMKKHLELKKLPEPMKREDKYGNVK